MKGFWGLVYESGVRALPMMVCATCAVVLSLAGSSDWIVGVMLGLTTLFGMAGVWGVEW